MTENRKENAREEDRRYTQVFETRCPVDSSKVKHTVTFIAASCSRVDDLIEDFHAAETAPALNVSRIICKSRLGSQSYAMEGLTLLLYSNAKRN